MSLVLGIQGSFADDNGYAKYPTLGKLCDAVKAYKPHGPIQLEIGTAVVSPSEIWELNMNCDYLNTFLGVDLTATHMVINGTAEIEETIKGFGRLQQQTTNGKPELDLVFESTDVKIAVRDFMRLNAQGQPVNTLNRFVGWLFMKSPTNANLDQPSGRVDFQAALKELAQALTEGGTNVSDQDFQTTLKSASDALGSSNN